MKQFKQTGTNIVVNIDVNESDDVIISNLKSFGLLNKDEDHTIERIYDFDGNLKAVEIENEYLETIKLEVAE